MVRFSPEAVAVWGDGIAVGILLAILVPDPAGREGNAATVRGSTPRLPGPKPP